MAPFLFVLLHQTLTFYVCSDMGNFAVVTEIWCTDADCCKNCQAYKPKTIDLDECYQYGASSVWVTYTCRNGNQFIYEEFDNSWCGGKPEVVKTSGRCYKDGLGGSYYFECASAIGRELGATPPNTPNNEKHESSLYTIGAIVIFIVFSIGIFGGYLHHKQGHRKKHQPPNLPEKELLDDS